MEYLLLPDEKGLSICTEIPSLIGLTLNIVIDVVEWDSNYFLVFLCICNSFILVEIYLAKIRELVKFLGKF